MRHDPLFTSWLVECPSAIEAQRLKAWLSADIAPDRIFEDAICAFPGGIATHRVELHRLGDYFEDIHLLPGSPETPSTFRILFHRREHAGRFWKEVMVRILQSLREVAPAVTTTLDSKGDEQPVLATRVDP